MKDDQDEDPCVNMRKACDHKMVVRRSRDVHTSYKTVVSCESAHSALGLSVVWLAVCHSMSQCVVHGRTSSKLPAFNCDAKYLNKFDTLHGST